MNSVLRYLLLRIPFQVSFALLKIFDWNPFRVSFALIMTF